MLIALVVGGLTLGLASCTKTASHTTIDGTWKNPQYQGAGLTKLFVVGIARAQESRERYETVMAEAIRSEGAAAEASFVAVGESKRLTKDQMRSAVEAGGFDGITFTHVLDVEYRTAQHEAEATLVPDSNVDYTNAYAQRYQTVTQPGYYDGEATYNVETIVYDAATGEKLWWAVSETVDPDSVDEAIREIAAATAKRMRDEGVIR